jgi:chemotaxis protein CheZ
MAVSPIRIPPLYWTKLFDKLWKLLIMTDAADDFEALFDEVSAQREASLAPAPAPAPIPAPVPAAESSLSNDEEAAGATSQNDSDKPMFDRLGGIVRQLHDSMRELGYDRSLAEVATEISDSKGRLEYIASLTEQAANKVLNSIDEGLPAQETLSKNAKDMDTRWGLLFEGKLSLEEFKVLAGDSRQFAALVAESSESEKARLMEIMMAQDFQDLTGQIIKKVVTITQKLEKELTQLLLDNAPAPLVKDKPVDLMQGPSVPNSALVQDDVDDLLADLGF